MKVKYLGYEEWFAEFLPIEGPDGFFLREDTFPKNLLDTTRLWSLVESDVSKNVLLIYNGFLENNIGFYVTEKPHKPGNLYCVMQNCSLSDVVFVEAQAA